MRTFAAAGLTLCAVPALAASFVIVDNALVPEHEITFAAGSDVLSSVNDAELDHIRGFLAEKTYVSLVRIEGHVGGHTAAEAQALSERRALAVTRWLVGHGVACKRLLPVGFGANKPLKPRADAANNRIEVKVAALRDRPIGGQPADGGGRVAGDACRLD